MKNVIAGLVAALMLLALPVHAQKANQTATQFYMEYRDAWTKSKSMDALLPYMSKDVKTQYEATPKEQRQPMFEMMKGMGSQITNVKVVKETKKGDGYVLDLSAVGPDKKPATGTADIVMEGGAMKMGKESWKM
jgi:hypothetical protein